LVTSIVLLPVFNNFREVLGIGNYNTNKDFNISLSGGAGGLNVDFDLDLTSDDKYTAKLDLNVISTGSVEKIGIISIKYYFYRELQLIDQFTPPSYSTPIISLQKTHINLHCYKNNEILLSGEASVKFLVGGIEQEELIEFELSIIITVSSADISYYWNVAEVWLQILDGIVILVIILILANLIRHIRFEKWYTEDHKKDDEEFFEKMREFVREKKKVPPSS